MRPFLFALICLLWAPFAHAQEVQNGQRFGPWIVNCTATAPGKTACVLGQQILRSSDQAFVAQVLAFQRPGTQQTFLSVRVPVGAYLPVRFAIRPEDSEEITEFVWQTCGRDLCEAVAEIDAAKLAALAAENRAILGAFRPGIRAENFVFRFSMASVTEGLAAIQVPAE